MAQRLRHASIITIDAQKTFIAKDGGLARLGFDTAPLRAVLPNIATLHQHARRAKIPFIHVRTIGGPGLNWSREVLAPAWLKRLEMAPPGTTLCSPGLPGIEFADEARPQEYGRTHWFAPTLKPYLWTANCLTTVRKSDSWPF